MRVLAAILLLALVASACKEIDADYQGTYVDASKKARLVISGRSAKLDVDGTSYRASAVEATYEALLRARAGFFLAENPSTSPEVFWLTPNASSRQEAGGVISYSAKVIYLGAPAFDSGTIALVVAEDGVVMLDTSTQRWQIGWRGNVVEYRLKRDAPAQR